MEWKKIIQARTGFEPMTSAIPVQRLAAKNTTETSSCK